MTPLPMPSLSALKPNLNLNLSLGRGGGSVVGLDIQPGYIAAVQAHVNGGIVVERAAGVALAPDIMREGEVIDERELGLALQELFRDAGLGKRVRVGLANQRTVLRTLELPPVADRKDLDTAVRFQAEDQVPMPLASAVLDYHSLGVFDTPNGPRQRVIVVAAQREMVERLLRAVQHAGLRPEGIDLSAFALIRSLYHPGVVNAQPAHEGEGSDDAAAERQERVLYLNVGGLTNMAIAEGTLCRFTRVVGGGLEAMASEIAERKGIPLVDARALLAEFDLPLPGAASQPTPPVLPEPTAVPVLPDPEAVDTLALAQTPEPAAAVVTAPSVDPEVRMVLENGIREIVGEVRNSLDFHRSQEGGGEVSSVVLSGPVLEMRGFAEVLEADLGLQVRRESVHYAHGGDAGAAQTISLHRLAIATGLATEEAPR
ncbi:MAG: pilus assembly protein PilM [Solirubrobacteraceae bacterium]